MERIRYTNQRNMNESDCQYHDGKSNEKEKANEISQLPNTITIRTGKVGTRVEVITETPQGCTLTHEPSTTTDKMPEQLQARGEREKRSILKFNFREMCASLSVIDMKYNYSMCQRRLLRGAPIDAASTNCFTSTYLCYSGWDSANESIESDVDFLEVELEHEVDLKIVAVCAECGEG